MAQLTPPLKYPGGKHYLASKIIALMPPHTHYVEPYFGGGAVLLAKDPEGISEVANDLDGGLTNFWEVLQHPNTFKKFSRIVQAIPFSEREWNKSSFHTTGSIAWAVRFFIRCRQSRSGMSKDFATLSRTRTRSGMNEQASAWLNAVEGLPEVHNRLKRVVILCRPALDVIKQQDGAKTLFYIDAPYVRSTRTSNLYAHEMTDDDHRELIQTLVKLKGKAIVSMYHHPIYDALSCKYGWKQVEIAIDNKLAGGKKKREMIECLWMNYKP